MGLENSRDQCFKTKTGEFRSRAVWRPRPRSRGLQDCGGQCGTDHSGQQCEREHRLTDGRSHRREATAAEMDKDGRYVDEASWARGRGRGQTR